MRDFGFIVAATFLDSLHTNEFAKGDGTTCLLQKKRSGNASQCYGWRTRTRKIISKSVNLGINNKATNR